MSYYDNDYDYDSPSIFEHEANQKAMRQSFKDNGDTYFGMTLDEYVNKFKELGFEEVLKDEFTHSHCGRERSDIYYVYAHKDGWLLTFDTYTGDNKEWQGVDQGLAEPVLNVCELHYNWQPSISITGVRGRFTSSGGFISYPEEGDTTTPAIWGGNHDVREGLSHAMEGLKANGTILNPWVKNTINWLASHTSVKEQDHSVSPGQAMRGEWDRWLAEMKARSQKNFDVLPQWVQQMIGRPS